MTGTADLSRMPRRLPGCSMGGKAGPEAPCPTRYWPSRHPGAPAARRPRRPRSARLLSRAPESLPSRPWPDLRLGLSLGDPTGADPGLDGARQLGWVCLPHGWPGSCCRRLCTTCLTLPVSASKAELAVDHVKAGKWPIREIVGGKLGCNRRTLSTICGLTAAARRRRQRKSLTDTCSAEQRTRAGGRKGQLRQPLGKSYRCHGEGMRG